jgi:hypothetical protein
VRLALPEVLKPVRPYALAGQPGPPSDCQSSALTRQDVRSCQVCVVILTPRLKQYDELQGLLLQRALLNIDFRLARSYAEPGVAAPAGGGVWVAAEAPRTSMPAGLSEPVLKVLVSRDLTNADIAAAGLQLRNSYGALVLARAVGAGGGQELSLRDAWPSFTTPAFAAKMQALVGACDGGIVK